MGLLVSVLLLHTPEFVQRMALVQLGKFTAAAFNADMPRLAGLNSEECLARYARFAAARAGQHLQEGREMETLERRLYERAFEMGKQQRLWFRPHSMQEMMSVGRVLYRMLQIDFQG